MWDLKWNYAIKGALVGDYTKLMSDILMALTYFPIVIHPKEYKSKPEKRGPPPWDRLNINMSSYQCSDPHVKDKTVSRPSYI